MKIERAGVNERVPAPPGADTRHERGSTLDLEGRPWRTTSTAGITVVSWLSSGARVVGVAPVGPYASAAL